MYVNIYIWFRYKDLDTFRKEGSLALMGGGCNSIFFENAE